MVPYSITLITDNQQESDATTTGVINTYEVSFSATFPAVGEAGPRIYSSTVDVPKQGTDVVSRIQAAVESAVSQVEAIYALGGTPPATA